MYDMRGDAPPRNFVTSHRDGKKFSLSDILCLLRLSRAFSATLTGRFGMGTVIMGAVVGTDMLVLTQHLSYL
jgi:hypothetical protein